MSFKNNLNNTYQLLNKLDDIIMKDADFNLLKKQLLSVTEDLAKYKDIDPDLLRKALGGNKDT